MEKKHLLQAKEAAGQAAARFIQDGMTVGLGTGSTVSFFIEALIKRCREGLKIKAVATSHPSFLQAQKGGISFLPMEKIVTLDITVDGADQIDPKKQMIKGGGGALLREKIVASISQNVVIIVDETKCVDRLGHCLLPVEIIPFCCQATQFKLDRLGYRGSFRQTSNRELFVTENGNYILDIKLEKKMDQPSEEHERIRSIPGVVETGLFFDMVHQVIIGFRDGRTEFRS